MPLPLCPRNRPTKVTPNPRSTEQLLSQERKLKSLAGILAGTLLVLLFIGMLLSFVKGFTLLLIIPFVLLPALLVIVNKLARIQRELRRRND